MTGEIHLTAIDGANPMGWLAAIGALEIATAAGVDARLAWASGPVGPVLAGTDVDELIESCLAEAGALAVGPLLAHDAGGAPLADVKLDRDGLRAWVSAVDRDGTTTERRLLGALVAEGSVDGSDQAKPTDLHFTAGQQKFIDVARGLATELADDDLHKAIFGPWAYTSTQKSFMWDITDDRVYALAATNPATTKKLTNPGVEWLAFRGLASTTLAAGRQRTTTTLAHGRWKSGAFTWPLWSEALTAIETRRLLQAAPTSLEQSPDEWRRRGVTRVYRSAITRSDQGGYGTFKPPQLLWAG